MSRGRPREDVRELIAKKRYTRALQVLRQQLTRPGVTVNQRMQLADLLVQLGRPAEAVPVFIGLAEELAKDGFIARAIAALKRVEKLDPGQPHVEARLAALARQGGRTASMLPSATPLPLKPPPPSRPELEIGIEEVGSETLVRLEGDRARRAAKITEEPPAQEKAGAGAAADVASFDLVPAKTPADEPPASPPAAPSPEAAAPSPESAASWPPVVAAVDEAAPALPGASDAASSPASGGVADRLRGVFRRFLAALPAPPPTPSKEPAGPAPTASPEPVEPTAAPDAAAPSSAAETASEPTAAPAASEPTPPASEPFAGAV